VVGVIELVLRLTVPVAGYPLFVTAPFSPAHSIANHSVGARWFPELADPPGPMQDPFATQKPASTIRLFVLGESTTAGFPYPRNGAFSRLLLNGLRKAWPGESIEVVNLGISATNSYSMWDMVDEIASEKPNAVLIYAGHNEYYGAFGASSRQGGFSPGPDFMHAYLRALRLRTVWLARKALFAVRRGNADDADAASLMEILGRDRTIPYESKTYWLGLRQMQSNLEGIVNVLRARGIPVFIGSVASNVRDQAPFAADSNAAKGGAAQAFVEARTALAKGDTVAARSLFVRARDLDVVRFRAPTELNAVIRAVVAKPHAYYVPVAEAFEKESPGGLPGRNLFLEHVHPNREGVGVIARAFFDALATSDVFRRRPQGVPLDWTSLEREVGLTDFDERVALHTINTITTRWPFVPKERQRDYRAEYHPSDTMDSLAFAVSRGASWAKAKLELAQSYYARGEFDSAAAEFRGLAVDAPLFSEPRVLLADALAAAGRQTEAMPELRSAIAAGASPRIFDQLGQRAIRRKAYREAVVWFTEGASVEPGNADMLYKLSLAYGMAGDVPKAREAAGRLWRIAPAYPGLREWLSQLGVAP
jgi:lysophospholipase L1-like esterase